MLTEEKEKDCVLMDSNNEEEVFRSCEEEHACENDDDDEYSYEYIDEEEQESDAQEIDPQEIFGSTKFPRKQPFSSHALILPPRKRLQTPPLLIACEPVAAVLSSDDKGANLHEESHRHASTCSRCGEESHVPFASCDKAAEWLRTCQEASHGVVTIVDPNNTVLHKTISKRLQDYATRLATTPEQAFWLMRRLNWREQALKDRRWNWDVLFRRANLPFQNMGRQHVLEQHEAFLDETIGDGGAAEAPEANDNNDDDSTTSETGEEQNTASPPAEEHVQEPQEAVASQAEPDISTTNICGICLEEQDDDDSLWSLDCGHAFCPTCWLGYLSTALEGNLLHHALRTSCPQHLCHELVTQAMLQRTGRDLVTRFQEHVLNAFVQDQRNTLRWCPGPECNRIISKCREGLFLEVNYENCGCQECGTRFCFECGEAPHTGGWPCRQGGVRQLDFNYEENPFLQGMNHDGAPQTPASARTRQKNGLIQRCPGCRSPIEKTGGCNHMHCKCGTSFCWVCLADFRKTGYRHFCGGDPARNPQINQHHRHDLGRNGIMPVDLDYICLSLVDDAPQQDTTPVQQDLLQKRRDIERLAHFCNRFVAHGQGQCFAQGQCDCVKKRVDDFCQVAGFKTATDADFLVVANERLVACRRLLKYSYGYVYFLTEESQQDVNAEASADHSDCKTNNTRLALFQNYQEQLERMTEQLSQHSEHPLTQMDRTRVVDLIEIVDRCMKAIVDFELEESTVSHAP